MSDDLATLDATAQADLVRSGDASPAELVESAIARIERVNPALNAVIHERFDAARAEASSAELPRGPFRGVPLLVKDLVCYTAGDPFHEGMKFLRDEGWREPRDSFLAAKLRAAGFVLVGKTNTSELGLWPTTEPEAYGAAHNPWDPTRSTGGSSGGSAAAVASGMVPVAHANDAGGSIRIPSSECGLVGLKPSRGRTSSGPEWPDAWEGFIAEHVVTRSVRDTAAVLDAVAGPMPGDRYIAPAPARPFAAEAGADPGKLRIGVLLSVPTVPIDLHPDCEAAARAAARTLESLGHDVEESFPEALADPGLVPRITNAFAAGYAAWALADWERRFGKPVPREGVEASTWAVAEIGRALSAPAYADTIRWLRADWAPAVERWWTTFDLLLSPTMAVPPPELGYLASSDEEPLRPLLRVLPFVSYTIPFNITGQPAISLPLHWNAAGLPIGVQLVAAHGREDLLIRVASQLEQASPWSSRRPPIHA